VFLAAGSDREDGLLQLREVADLPLAGQTVVLSACRSASGSVLRGEGVVGLGRAFFQAGSHAVVGSLWPLRDDDAARLFRSFYRGLSRGSSVGAALRGAQREAIRDGLPAAAWAGLVAVGDGSVAPLTAAAAPRAGVGPWLVAGVVAAALALSGLLLRVRRPSFR
jgi:CHAT domain-containing protein